MTWQPPLLPLDDRGPLRVMFVITSMPVGGAEMLLVNLVRCLDRARFVPEICCLKERGPLGEELADEIPVHSHLLRGKYDMRVLARLQRLLRLRKIDAVVTVGAGDKMFWGRLAAWRANAPVVLSALHSTGWPDGVGRLNRLLTPITDGFIGVAEPHGRFLVEFEGFPASKVRVIPNGVDTERFQPRPEARRALRSAWGIDDAAPVAGVVAALRPEKNVTLLLQAAALVRSEAPEARFVIVGDGPQRRRLEQTAADLQVADAVHFLGARRDVPEVLSALDVFSLTSHNEANPVSILEAMATELPVVATKVGSVPETVRPGETGFLVEPGDARHLADRLMKLWSDRPLARRLGADGRELVVEHWSLDAMVRGYETLIAEIYESKLPPEHRQTAEPQSEAADALAEPIAS